MGRIAPQLLRPGRRDPAHRGCPRCSSGSTSWRASTGCRWPTSSTPATATCTRSSATTADVEGEAERAEELAGRDPRRLPGGRRLDHRRARRRRRQEAAHAEDVRRGRPGRVPAPALRVRPGRAGEPRQGDADAAAVRRGARARTASTRSRRPGWRSGSDGRRGRAAGRPARASEAAALRAGGPGGTLRVRGGGTKLGWGRAGRAARASSSRPAGWTAIVEHNVGDLTAILEAGVPLARRAGRASPSTGQMLALDPPDRRRDDRRRRRHRRLRPAAPPLRRRRATSWSASPSRSSDGTRGQGRAAR